MARRARPRRKALIGPLPAGGCAALLFACSPAFRDPAGWNLARGSSYAPPVPASVLASVEVAAMDPATGKTGSSAMVRLRAEPPCAYRMDVYPFPGVLAATLIWDRGRWQAVDWDKKRYAEGRGSSMTLPGLAFSLPDPEMLWGFLWGRPLPHQIGTLRATACGPQPIPLAHAQALLARVSGDTLFYAEDGTWLRQDAESQAIVETGHGPWVMRYADHELHAERALPRRAVLLRRAPDGPRPLLKATVSQVQDHPPPRPQAFQLTIPSDFTPLEGNP